MTTPNKYQANGKKWPNGTIWMNWQMVNGEWCRLNFYKGLPEDQQVKPTAKPAVDWAGFIIYIALLLSIIGLCGLAAFKLGTL